MPAPPLFLDVVDVRMPELVGRGRGREGGLGVWVEHFFLWGCGLGRFMMAGCRLGSGGGGWALGVFLTCFVEWRALGRDSAEIYTAECTAPRCLANYQAQIVSLWNFHAVEEMIRMILILDTDYMSTGNLRSEK